MKFKFNCSRFDRKGNVIPNSGHGDIDHVICHCYAFLDRPGEGYYISFGTDGKFFFTEDQAKYMPGYWSQDAIIKLAEKWSNHGHNLNIEQCYHKNCRNDVEITQTEQ